MCILYGPQLYLSEHLVTWAVVQPSGTPACHFLIPSGHNHGLNAPQIPQPFTFLLYISVSKQHPHSPLSHQNTHNMPSRYINGYMACMEEWELQHRYLLEEDPDQAGVGASAHSPARPVDTHPSLYSSQHALYERSRASLEMRSACHKRTRP